MPQQINSGSLPVLKYKDRNNQLKDLDLNALGSTITGNVRTYAVNQGRGWNYGAPSWSNLINPEVFKDRTATSGSINDINYNVFEDPQLARQAFAAWAPAIQAFQGKVAGEVSRNSQQLQAAIMQGNPGRTTYENIFRGIESAGQEDFNRAFAQGDTDFRSTLTSVPEPRVAGSVPSGNESSSIINASDQARRLAIRAIRTGATGLQQQSWWSSHDEATRQQAWDLIQKTQGGEYRIDPSGQFMRVSGAGQGRTSENRLGNQPDSTVNGSGTGRMEEEKKRINDEANKEMEEELAKITSETNKVDLSSSASLIQKLIGKLEDEPSQPSKTLEQKFTEKRAELGVGPLEDELNGIDAQIKQLDSDFASLAGEEENRRVSVRQIRRRQSEQELNYQRQRRDLLADRNSIADQLNSKYSVLNTMMTLAGQDYNNAQQNYQFEFNKNLQLVNLLKGVEDSEKTQQEQLKDNARANLQIMQNLFKNNNIDYDSLSSSQKVDLRKLELQAGFPAGFAEFIHKEVKAPVVHYGNAYTDINGNQIQPILTYDENGNIKNININQGRAAQKASDKPASFKEWELAGGQKGTGKTYAQWIAKKPTSGGGGGAETINRELQDKVLSGEAIEIADEEGDVHYFNASDYKARLKWIDDNNVYWDSGGNVWRYEKKYGFDPKVSEEDFPALKEYFKF